MFSSSISSTVAKATLYCSASRQMTSNSASRRFSVSFFESSRPGITRSRGSVTAAAHTGPASGPRPASSTPQSRSYPSA